MRLVGLLSPHSVSWQKEEPLSVFGKVLDFPPEERTITIHLCSCWEQLAALSSRMINLAGFSSSPSWWKQKHVVLIWGNGENVSVSADQIWILCVSYGDMELSVSGGCYQPALFLLTETAPSWVHPRCAVTSGTKLNLSPPVLHSCCSSSLLPCIQITAWVCSCWCSCRRKRRVMSLCWVTGGQWRASMGDMKTRCDWSFCFNGSFM